jgi:UDP-N-acetylglucosamine--N-acetylmuramyl-(pentapeptide) pyrophosphoryl-undecaprenol N-acetylglucosamine transferase
MNIVFAGGGTAGHVSPSLAVAEKLAHISEEATITFIGRASGAENEATMREGYELHTIEAKGLPRRLSIDEIKKLPFLIKAPREAEKILKDLEADAVFATGGYVSYPVLKAAKRLHIPYFLHESNTYPGLVTRLCAKDCLRVYLGAPSDSAKIRKLKNAQIVGNPLRRGFGDTERSEARRQLGIKSDEIFIVSVGGSLGAGNINSAIFSLMHAVSAKSSRVRHLHSCGKRYFDIACKKEPLFTRGALGCKIVPYITDMNIYLAAADIVISRAGAMTLSEIAASRAPAVIIPSPNVTDDHQYKNALHYARLGVARIIKEAELPSGALTSTVLELIHSPDMLARMKEAYSAIPKNDAAEKIAKDILGLITGKQM